MKAKTLKELRENRNMTQNQVAILTGKTVTYISLLENGHKNPSDTMKKRLADLYECNITDIFLALQLTNS